MLEVLSFLTFAAGWIVLTLVLLAFLGLVFLIMAESSAGPIDEDRDIPTFVKPTRRAPLRSVDTQSSQDQAIITRATEYRNDFTG